MPFPLYVISLPHARERRAALQQDLDRLGLTATFIDGVLPDAVSDADRARYDRTRCLGLYGIDMLPQELACVLAHQRALKAIAEGDAPFGVVLEDDVSLDDAFPATIRALAKTPAPGGHVWDMVRLGTSRAQAVARCVATRGADLDVDATHGIYRLPIHILGAIGYAATRQGARKALRHGDRIFMPFDHMLDRFWENGIDPFVVFPPVVSHRDALASEIGDRSKSRRAGASATVRWRRRLNRWNDGLRKRLHRFRYF